MKLILLCIPVFLGILFVTVALTVKVWLVGSLLTSSVKAMSDDCGKTYGVELVPVIQGNWFCTEKARK